MSLDWNRQKTEEPSKQHGFAQFYFTHTFQLLGVSLGHIFKVRQSDVDMRDVVLNRRILVVNLPALESSGRPGMECVEAAIEAAGEAPLSAGEIAPLAPHAPLQAMMLAATSRPPKAPSTPPALYAGDGGRGEETRAFIESIEIAAGVSAADARQAAAMVLGAGQAIEARGAVRGAAEEEAVRSIQALTGDMVSAARQAVAAEAREAASPRLVGATL